MEKESWKYLIGGLVVLTIFVYIIGMIIPMDSFKSYLISIVAAVIVGVYLSIKIRSIEK